MSRILILTDYRSQFYSSVKKRGASLDVRKVSEGFKALGYAVEVTGFSRVRTSGYEGVYALYQSSEDDSLHYKQYIEDILLGLQLKGAILVPRFELFRAHHNKVFMEILRSVYGREEELGSRHYGTFEEYSKDERPLDYPIVIKSSAGSKSRQVFLARDKREAHVLTRKVSSTPSIFNITMWVRDLLDRKGYVPVSNHRARFVVQRFIPGLVGDYKVLVYGEEYFVLFRENRPGDFRASGSGKLSFPEAVPVAVLDEARRTYLAFDVPYVSLDIGFDGERTHVLEFQFVQFGQYAVEKSPHHFRYSGDGWQLIRGPTTAEKELVAAVHAFIRKGGSS